MLQSPVQVRRLAADSHSKTLSMRYRLATADRHRMVLQRRRGAPLVWQLQISTVPPSEVPDPSAGFQLVEQDWRSMKPKRPRSATVLWQPRVLDLMAAGTRAQMADGRLAAA
jgi:hypothetical protein